MLIPLKDLRNNLLNSNVMIGETFEKLKKNIKKQKGRYPMIIVRKIKVPPNGFDKMVTEGEMVGYRIIDGHNRVKALRELGYAEATCDVWEDIDDETEIMLLSTLNELKGTQDLVKRASLIQAILDMGISRESLVDLIPEDNRRLDFILGIIESKNKGELISDLELRRNTIRQDLINKGVEPKRAEAMADIYAYKDYVPKDKKNIEGTKVGTRKFLVFWFNTEEDFKLAEKYFEAEDDKEPKTEKLINLIK